MLNQGMPKANYRQNLVVRAYSTGANPPSPSEAAVMVGLAMVVIAGMLLWHRRDLYWVYQWIIRYPQSGITYAVLQIAIPVTVIIAGVALILWPVIRW